MSEYEHDMDEAECDDLVDYEREYAAFEQEMRELLDEYAEEQARRR